MGGGLLGEWELIKISFSDASNRGGVIRRGGGANNREGLYVLRKFGIHTHPNVEKAITGRYSIGRFFLRFSILWDTMLPSPAVTALLWQIKIHDYGSYTIKMSLGFFHACFIEWVTIIQFFCLGLVPFKAWIVTLLKHWGMCPSYIIIIRPQPRVPCGTYSPNVPQLLLWQPFTTLT